MNADQPTPAAQLATFLSRFSPEIVALANKCMAKLRSALPGSNQIVYDYAHSVVVSFSMSEHGYEAIVAIAIASGSVKLYFDRSIPDPKRLLEGSGSKVRSVSVSTASELDEGDIHALLSAAIKHSGVTFSRAGTNRMIIQSETKKKKSKSAKQP